MQTSINLYVCLWGQYSSLQLQQCRNMHLVCHFFVIHIVG